MVRKYAFNKGYALIIVIVLITPTCMVMVASASATKRWFPWGQHPGTRLAIANVLKNIQSGGSYEIERTKLKISTMMRVGDLEESIFLHSLNKSGHISQFFHKHFVWFDNRTPFMKSCIQPPLPSLAYNYHIPYFLKFGDYFVRVLQNI